MDGTTFAGTTDVMYETYVNSFVSVAVTENGGMATD